MSHGTWLYGVFAIAIFADRMREPSFRIRLFLTSVFSLTFLLFLLHWSSAYVGVLPWFFLAIGESVFYLPLAFIRFRGEIEYALAFSSGWVFVEFVRRNFPFGGFGWGRLGFITVQSPFSSALPMGGVALGSFVMVLFSATLASFAHNFDRRALVLLVLPTLSISLLAKDLVIVSQQPSLRIALVQGGVPELGLRFNDNPKAVFDRQYSQTLTSIAPGSVDLIVWPENTVLISTADRTSEVQLIQRLSRQLLVPIQVGAVESRNGKLFNESILIRPNSREIYIKRKLVPFGEFIPIRFLAEKVSPLTQSIRDFSSGNTRVDFKVMSQSISPMLCYEILDDEIVRSAAKYDSILVVQTNNATFGRTQELFQERQIAIARALEVRRPIAYDSTTGITSFIRHNGKIDSALSPFTPGTLTAKVSGTTKITPSVKYGKVIELLIILCFIGLVTRRWQRDEVFDRNPDL